MEGGDDGNQPHDSASFRISEFTLRLNFKSVSYMYGTSMQLPDERRTSDTHAIHVCAYYMYSGSTRVIRERVADLHCRVSIVHMIGCVEYLGDVIPN